MRVLLVSANTERINMPAPPLGAAMVAAAARQRGHQVSLLDLLGRDDPEQAVAAAIAGTRPQLIGISVRNIDDQNMARTEFLLERVKPVVRACREASRAPLVLGGAGYSIFPVAALAELGADFGIAGEGELAFCAFLEAMSAGVDPGSVGAVYRAGSSEAPPRLPSAPFDELPSPYPELIPCLDLDDPELWVPLQTRRGCALDCSYCSTPLIEGRQLRRRSPTRVVADVAALADAGVSRIQFVDNTFNLPPGYALELCRRLAELDLKPHWRAIVYPFRVSAELVEAMAAAGCAEVSIGSESCCDPILESLNKRFDAAEVRRVVELFRDAGIAPMGFLLLGVPGETRQSVRDSLDVAHSLPLSSLKITVGVRIYPGTPMARQAVAEGVISADDSLLRPRFYLAPGLAGWLDDELETRDWPMPVWR